MMKTHTQLNLLIIVSSPNERERVVQLLSGSPQCHFRIKEAESLEAALPLLNCYEPDCLLVDFPSMNGDGEKIQKAIKNQDSHESIPIICMIDEMDDGNITELTTQQQAGPFLVKNQGAVESWTLCIEAAVRQARMVGELRKTIDSLTESNTRLTNFASVAAHDLQSPIRKIATFGTRLREKIGDEYPEHSRIYIDKIVESSEKIENLIQAILENSKLNNQKIECVPIDLRKLLGEVTSALELEVQLSNAVIEIEALPRIEGDYNLFFLLFLNLLSNSLKFHKKGCPPHIRIAQYSKEHQGGATGEGNSIEEYCHIEVVDDGIGFKEEDSSRIFEMFQQAHSKKEFGGCGIGLATCKAIVDKHHGSIRATSQPGQGTTFVVSLPTVHRAGIGERCENHAANTRVEETVPAA